MLLFSIMIRYFAFGSNLVPSTLQSRTLTPPWSSSKLDNPTPAVVPGWNVFFNLGNPAAASLEKCEDQVAEGVLYDLDVRQWALLCATEGVPLAYKIVSVQCVQTRDGKTVGALTLSSGKGTKNNPTSRRYW